MKHYVYLKLTENCDTAALIGETERVLRKAQNSLEGMETFQLLQEFNGGADPCSLLIILSFRSEVDKDIFLKCPLHQKLLQTIKASVAMKSVFDITA